LLAAGSQDIYISEWHSYLMILFKLHYRKFPVTKRIGPMLLLELTIQGGINL
jgi:hypothetical protein